MFSVQANVSSQPKHATEMFSVQTNVSSQPKHATEMSGQVRGSFQKPTQHSRHASEFVFDFNKDSEIHFNTSSIPFSCTYTRPFSEPQFGQSEAKARVFRLRFDHSLVKVGQQHSHNQASSRPALQ
jgi:hypothetical protein